MSAGEPRSPSPPASPSRPGRCAAVRDRLRLLARRRAAAVRGDRARAGVGLLLAARRGGQPADAGRPRAGGRRRCGATRRGSLAWALPGALAGVAVLRALDAVALQLARHRRRARQRSPCAGARARAAGAEAHAAALGAPGAGLSAGALTTSTTTRARRSCCYLLRPRRCRRSGARHADRRASSASRSIGALALAVTGTTGALPDATLARRARPARRASAHLAGRPRVRPARARARYERVLTGVLLVARASPGWSPRVALSRIRSPPEAFRRDEMAQAHGDRLTAVDASFLAQEGATSHMHVGAVLIFEGPPPAYDDFVNHIRGAAAPRPALPPEARVPAARDRPAAVGRRPELQPRVPRPPHRAAGAGLRGAAARARRAHPLPAARPLEAAVGDVARAGARGRPLRADLQDPPRARRRHRRRRPRSTVLFDLDAGPAAAAARGRAVGAAAPSRARSTLAARGVRGLVRLPFELAGRARRRRDAPGASRSTARARRSRASARSPGRG